MGLLFNYSTTDFMKVFFQIIIAFFIINISFAQVNYYVSPSGNDGNDGSQANPWATIGYAVNSVPNPTSDQIIINISSGIYDLLNIQIDINRSFSNLTLLGEGSDSTFIQSATDTSLSNSRVIQVYSGNNVMIKDITVRYGRIYSPNLDGGGILNKGGNLIIEKCKVVDNIGGDLSGIGGGIGNDGGNLIIRSSTISYNQAAKRGQGGGIGSKNGTLNVYNSTISYNVSRFTVGGIFVVSNGADAIFNMENSTVYGNNADSAYGGIRITIFGGLTFNVTTNINSCTIYNNSTLGVRGGIGLSTPSNFNIKNSIVAGNSPSNLSGVDGSGIIVNSGGFNIFQTYDNLTINGATNNGIGVDPGLLPFADHNSNNGTKTCAITDTSAAKDQIPAGSPNGAPPLDQRGFQRVGNYDIGAYEYTPPFATVNAKVFLEGPYDGAGAMTTTLNTNNLIPLNSNDAYSTSTYGYTASNVTSIPNADIVDWVLIELRSDLTTVESKRAAFLKSDGTIVDVNGSSPVIFNGISEGNYYIVIRHRNHLSIMSASAVALSGTSSLYDFTTNQNKAYGTNSMWAFTGGGYGMIAGDINKDGIIKYNLAGNDRAIIFTEIGGVNINATVTGYNDADVNLDGIVKYNLAGNDRAIIYQSIGGININTTISTQVPN
jgi:hypothetical protein